MLERIIIKKWKHHGGYKYILECNFCHKYFQIVGFIFNGGQGKFCSLKCFYNYKKGKPRLDKITWGDKISKSHKGLLSGKKHPNWKGGKIFNNGYVIIFNPQHPFPNIGGKYVYEHRLIMEQKLGRYLTRQERIHHLNGIRIDNRIENLVLFSNATEHIKIHNHKRNLKGQFFC